MIDQKVVIHMTGHGQGRVFIGGKEVHNVVDISFSASARRMERNIIMLRISPLSVLLTSDETEVLEND